MVVVVLSVTPERLRGVLTRWLVEVSVGVYVGHLPARVREHLWLRILEDVGRGRALMVWSRQGEQRLDFRTHNHAWGDSRYRRHHADAPTDCRVPSDPYEQGSGPRATSNGSSSIGS